MNGMLPLVLVVILFSGCMSHAARPTKPVTVGVNERPPVTISRQQVVADRTQALLKSGQYQDREAAFRAASAEVPDFESQQLAEWSKRRERALKQKAIQDKFEQELSKLELK